ncbi:hypothetical protein [Methylomicrobium lacus]|uniref:hypothetical protein n=1 Tax=Methylomicrobium lacus TaxID=136992 RepID=UPI0035A87508
MILSKPNTLTLAVEQIISPLFFVILVDSLIYFKVDISGDAEIANENHFLENLQLILLFASGVAFLQTMMYVQKGQRLLPALGALLCLSFILRELDVEKFDLPQALVFLGSGYGRSILLSGLWLLLSVLFVRDYKHYLTLAVHILPTRSGVFLVAGGLLVGVASLFDGPVFEFYRLYEALSEMNGYFLLLVSSLSLFFDLPRNSKPPSAIKFNH